MAWIVGGIAFLFVLAVFVCIENALRRRAEEREIMLHKTTEVKEYEGPRGETRVEEGLIFKPDNPYHRPTMVVKEKSYSFPNHDASPRVRPVFVPEGEHSVNAALMTGVAIGVASHLIDVPTTLEPVIFDRIEEPVYQQQESPVSAVLSSAAEAVIDTTTSISSCVADVACEVVSSVFD